MDIILESSNGVNILVETSSINLSIETIISESQDLDIDQSVFLDSIDINTSNITIEPIQYNITIEPIEIIRPPEYSWVDYITSWSEPPEYQLSISGGDVYLYTMSTNIAYRFVPNPYTTSGDAFYSGFNGSVLSGFLVSRG